MQVFKTLSFFLFRRFLLYFMHPLYRFYFLHLAQECSIVLWVSFLCLKLIMLLFSYFIITELKILSRTFL